MDSATHHPEDDMKGPDEGGEERGAGMTQEDGEVKHKINIPQARRMFILFIKTVLQLIKAFLCVLAVYCDSMAG